MGRQYLPRGCGGPKKEDVQGTGEPSEMPLLDWEAFSFVLSWMAELGEASRGLCIDERLCRAAQKHAEWLHVNRIRERRHIGEGGSTANERVRAEGYTLPGWYSEVGNQVESVGEEFDAGPQQALANLLASPHHRMHLLRLNDFFATHTRHGVGESGGYYVVLTAPVEM